MNPEVLSLIKLAGVFAIIIGLLSMKKPLNLVMSIASIVVVVLYALPVGQVLPALKTGLIGLQHHQRHPGAVLHHLSAAYDGVPQAARRL